MAARIRGFRTVAGLPTLLALATVASMLNAHRDALAQQPWAGRTVRSVVVRQGDRTIATDDGLVVPDSVDPESVTPRVADGGSFEGQADSRGAFVEGSSVYPGGMSGPHAFVSSDPPYDHDGVLVQDGQICGPECMPGCPHGMTGHHGRPWFNAVCEPVGFAQRLAGLLHHHGKDTCWTARGDALILWRNAPQTRPLYTTNPEVAGFSAVALDASQLESPAAGGGRLQLFRQDRCGNLLEFGYLYGGQFFGEVVRPNIPGAYLTAPPGLDGVDFPEAVRALDQVGAQLLGSIQSAEINRRIGVHESMQFLYGFRWFQWYERSLVLDTFGEFDDPPTFGADIYSTSTINNLWGGQIGIDSLLLRTRHGFRVEGVVKAGVYANNAGQTSRYLQVDEAGGFASQVTVNDWPASASFVGEVGMTGVVPISECWDFRFGYLGLWLTGLAQPTNQLSGQNIAQGVEPPTGSLSTVGTAIVQGVTLGLEGRW